MDMNDKKESPKKEEIIPSPKKEISPTDEDKSSPHIRYIKINIPLRGYKAGAIIPIRVDAKGWPLDPYWDRRLRDSKIDHCVEIVKKR